MSHFPSRIRSLRSLSGTCVFAASVLVVSAITLATGALAGSQEGGAADRPISVVAFAKAKAGAEDRLKTLALNLVAPSRAEKGNISYDLHQVIDDKTTFVFYENWASMDAFNSHKESPDFQKFLAATKDILDGALKVTLMNKISPPIAK